MPIGKSLQGILTQLRLRPGVQAEEAVGRWGESLPAKRGDSFEIDWVSLLLDGETQNPPREVRKQIKLAPRTFVTAAIPVDRVV